MFSFDFRMTLQIVISLCIVDRLFRLQCQLLGKMKYIMYLCLKENPFTKLSNYLFYLYICQISFSKTNLRNGHRRQIASCTQLELSKLKRICTLLWSFQSVHFLLPEPCLSPVIQCISVLYTFRKTYFMLHLMKHF